MFFTQSLLVCFLVGSSVALLGSDPAGSTGGNSAIKKIVHRGNDEQCYIIYGHKQVGSTIETTTCGTHTITVQESKSPKTVNSHGKKANPTNDDTTIIDHTTIGSTTVDHTTIVHTSRMSKVGRDVGSKGTTTTIIHHTTIIHPHIPTITAGLQRRNESMATATMAPTSTTSSDCVIANASHAIKTKTLTSGTLLYTVLETGAYTTNGSQCNPTVYYSGTSRRPTRTGADGNGEEEDASATASISPKPTNAGSKIAMSFGMVIFVGIVTFLCISL